MFGGAFDPPHRAHRALAEAALAQLGLDLLLILPTGQAWHKSRSLTPAEHRVAMCELAFAGLPKVRIDPREIRREGPTYSADTLAELAAEFPGARLFLLMGADQLLAFRTWKRWQEVLQCATLAVAGRSIETSSSQCKPAEWLAQDIGGIDIPHILLELPPQPHSATSVRARVAGSGPQADLDALVSEGVARYISEHHLYRHAT
ncbi:MAG: nicotinate (nicotinamide) nucleotide adenylyltransferase [Pseudomonadota bacterium]|jgi:nicotinate-nucleotide adenylyltransferase